jgi:alkanesulfonate monooxygenase SsuD/methylene tetrahydromethanopterin reductase-like flavin-dependent oxidoreductase (luciferase family)
MNADAIREPRFGAQLWGQGGTWQALRDAGVAMDDAGWDLLMTWDHLLAIEGPWDQPSLEGWSVLAAWAVLTRRVELGLLVGANTFRNPGLTAKLATTLDHLSNGRAILGIGAAWFEREHDAHGIDFGQTVGERIDRLEESVAVIRRLLDGERFDHAGRFYTFRDVHHLPLPVRDHLPILIGGSGPRRTLRVVARYADAWDTAGSPKTVAERDRLLRDHCFVVGRDPAQIQRMLHVPILIRDSAADGERANAEALRANNVAEIYAGLYGPPGLIASQLRPYLDLGFRTFIALLPPPYDRETIRRIGEIRELLAP